MLWLTKKTTRGLLLLLLLIVLLTEAAETGGAEHDGRDWAPLGLGYHTSAKAAVQRDKRRTTNDGRR